MCAECYLIYTVREERFVNQYGGSFVGALQKNLFCMINCDQAPEGKEKWIAD